MINIDGLEIKPITPIEFDVHHVNLIQTIAKTERSDSKAPTFA